MEAKRKRQLSIFDDQRMTLENAIQMSLASLKEYGDRYDHWAIAYSGGKDSTATVAFVLWAIESGMVRRPESLTVLYADTRMELPPLQISAINVLREIDGRGHTAKVVLPGIDDRFYVYMLGRGVPPPKNRFRWCTPMIKVEPMMNQLKELRERTGHKFLMITGVRIGESAARDQRIALSCSRDTGECGQGWFQVTTPESMADTLAPLLHWRVCNVFDWLYFDERHGLDVAGIAHVYGEDDIRTGCVGCNLASRDNALEKVIKYPEWEHLMPLLELKPLYRELTKAQWRKRKSGVEINKDGTIGKNPQRMGPLTMEGRAYGLASVLDIQRRARVDLINEEEERRIREMWADNVWPERWSDQDIDADDVYKPVFVLGKQVLVQENIFFDGRKNGE